MLNWSIFSRAVASKEICIRCDAAANCSRAFEIYVLMIYDEGLLSNMLNMHVNSFLTKPSIIYENQAAMQVYIYHVIPGKSHDPFKIPLRLDKKLMGCLLFCNFYLVANNTSIVKKVDCGLGPTSFVVMNEKGCFLLR